MLACAELVAGRNVRGSQNKILNNTKVNEQDFEQRQVTLASSKIPKRQTASGQQNDKSTALRILRPKQAKGNPNPKTPKDPKKAFNVGRAYLGDWAL